MTVAEYDPVGADTHAIRTSDGTLYTCSQWCDVLEPEAAEPLAWYEDDFYAGKPAVTTCKLGAGQVIYIGTVAEERYYIDLFRIVAESAGLSRFDDLPEGVQVSVRTSASARYVFIANLSRQRQQVKLKASYDGLLSGTKLGSELELEPYGTEIAVLSQ